MSENDLDLALELADLGAAIALPRFERGEFVVERKGDASPVTDVDREVEDAMRARLAEQRPGHAVMGEERGAHGESDWRWYLDPIDGTHLYIAGETGWMVLVALAHRDQVVAGVISLPARRQRWWAARGAGAWRDGRRLSVTPTPRLAQAAVRDDWRSSLARGCDGPLARVAARAGSVLPHAGHSLLGVAAGEADVAVARGGYAWDYAAPFIVVEEAGGRFTDFAGARRFDARQAVVSNGRIHGEALAAIQAGG